MAEVIITEFVAETGQFVASIDKAEASVIGLDKSEKDAQKSTAALSQQLGSAAGKATAHKVAMAEVAKATGTAATGSAALGKALASADFSGATAESKALAAVLISLGDQGQQAFDALNLSAEDTIGVLRELIAEASKTPQGAAALATELTEAQQAALSTLQTMGALTAEEAEVVAQAVKLQQAQSQVSEETKETGKEYVSLRTQVKKAKEELNRMIDASDGRITPELIAAAKKAGELQDRFEDVNATIEAFNPDKKFAAFSGVVTNLAGGFTAVQGALALVGGESETVSRGLLKVQSALAISQGLQSLFGGLGDNLKNLKLVLTASAAGTTTFTGALGGARAAMLALNGAIAANPIGAATTAVVALAGALYLLGNSMNSASVESAGLVETLERIVALRAENVSEQADQAAFAREQAAAEELLQIERERAAINASRASAEQKALRLQVLADRAAAIERKRASAASQDALVQAQQAAAEAATARGIVEQRLSKAYVSAGQRYISGLKLQGQALVDAADAGSKLSADQIAALNARKGLMKRLSDEDKEALVKLEEAREAYVKQEADALKKSERAWNQREISATNAEIETTREAAKQAELRKNLRKAEDAGRKEADDKRAAAQRAVDAAVREIDEAAAAIVLSDIEKRDAAVRASFEKQIEVARAAFAELSRLATSDSEREEIAKREAQAIIDADAAMEAELERLRQQDIAGVRAYGATKQKLQEDEINERFDLRRSETEKLIESEEERTAILAQIERDRAEELAAIREDAAAKERERQIDDAQAVLDSSRNLGQSLIAIDNAVTANRIADIDARIAAAKKEGRDTSALEKEREREQKEAARRAYQINKAFTLAQIAVDTARAIASAVAAAAENPLNGTTFGAAGAAQFAAELIRITANVAQAIALIAQKQPGFARGGEVDAGWGPKTRRANGDNVVATLQDREIVLSRASRARAERIFGRGVWGELGVPGFGGSVDWTNALARVGAANADRNGGSSIVQQRDDRRIIGALGGVGSLREQRRQTELLEELARTRGRNPRSRWA